MVSEPSRSRVRDHRPFQLAAQIAFFFLLAAQPLLIVLTAVLAYLPTETLEPRIAAFIHDAVPGDVGERLATIVTDVLENRHPRLISIAVVALLWTASSGTKAVIDATTSVRGLLSDPRPWWRRRLRALAITGVLVVLVAVGGGLAAGVLGFMRRFFEIDLPARWMRGAELALGFLLIVTGIQLVYRFGPPPGWRRPALPGAIVAVITGLAASEGLSLYVRHIRDLNAIYGSLGALVLLVLWFYVVAIALVLGAEVNALLARRRQGREDARGGATRRSLPEALQGATSAS